jgi:hypothetical protein
MGTLVPSPVLHWDALFQWNSHQGDIMFNEVSVPNSLHAGNRQRPLLSKKVVRGMFLVAFAVLTLSQTTGCRLNKLAFTDAWMLSYRDAVWSKRAFNLNYGNCDQAYAADFEAGFRAGYQDIACGGDGYVPAMPPNEYRSFEYQSADGAQCVNAWFEGYPAGVKTARKEDVGTYHNVLISRMINAAVTQSETVQKLPADVPIISADLAKGSNVPIKPAFAAPPVPPTRPASHRNPLPFPRSQPNMRPPVTLPTHPTATPAMPNSTPVNSTAPENSEAAVEIVKPDARVAATQFLPPIVTGSGLLPETQNLPTTPSTVQPASWESNRRNR